MQTSTVSQWKTNNITPNAEFLIKIAEFLDVSLDFLMTGKEASSTTTINSHNNGIGNIIGNNNNSNNNFFANKNEKTTPLNAVDGLSEMATELVEVFEKLTIKNKI